MATGSFQDERRRFSRIAFHRPARFTTGAATGPCGVLDVSLKGALVDVPPWLVVDRHAPCSVVIDLDQGESIIHLDGEVAHREGTRLGVRCTAIDLESIGHLRRVVELNLGDEELLHRELETLVGGG
jgi:hypothetical protein